jgi:hypothetical protein
MSNITCNEMQIKMWRYLSKHYSYKKSWQLNMKTSYLASAREYKIVQPLWKATEQYLTMGCLVPDGKWWFSYYRDPEVLLPVIYPKDLSTCHSSTVHDHQV